LRLSEIYLILFARKERNNKSRVMDLSVSWYQEEQLGEAKRIWSNIWETAEMVRIFALNCVESRRNSTSLAVKTGKLRINGMHWNS